jgi:hypothetical protein
MTKEDIADILICIGNALRGFTAQEPQTEEVEQQQEIGVIEEAPQVQEEQQQPQLPATPPLAIEVPNMAEQIKQIFDQQNMDPHKLAMQGKELEIQLLKDQIAALQKANGQTTTTGNIG